MWWSQWPRSPTTELTWAPSTPNAPPPTMQAARTSILMQVRFRVISVRVIIGLGRVVKKSVQFLDPQLIANVHIQLLSGAR